MKSSVVAVFLLVSLALSSAARGAVDADRLMAQGDFERALLAFNGMLKRKPSPNVAARIHVKRAQCYAALQKSGPARDALKNALQLNPDVSLDPAFANPMLLDLLSEARSATQGELSVSSELSDSELRIDGRSVGPPPLKMSASVGKHRVDLITRDGAVRTKDVRVRYQKSVRVHFDLETQPNPTNPSEVAARSPAQVIDSEPEMSEAERAEASIPASVSTADLEVKHSPQRKSVKAGPVVMVGGGVVLLAGGIAGMVHALNVKAAFDAANPPGTPPGSAPPPGTPAPTVTREDAQLAKTLLPISVSAAVVGAALGGVGAWLLFRPDESGAGASASVVPLLEGGAMVQVGGRF